MTTVLGIVAILSLHPRLTISLWRQRRRRERNPGLNTVVEARNYAQVLHVAVPGETTAMLHHAKELTVPRLRTIPLVIEMVRTETAPVFAWDVRTPIYDELVADRERARRALRMPTAEMKTVFDSLVDRWLCSHCEGGDCGSCPGCSCGCKMPVLIGRPPLVGVS